MSGSHARVALRFPQMCAYLEGRALRCVDLADPHYRPGDRAFWQCDLFFAPAGQPLFERNVYG